MVIKTIIIQHLYLVTQIIITLQVYLVITIIIIQLLYLVTQIIITLQVYLVIKTMKKKKKIIQIHFLIFLNKGIYLNQHYFRI